MDKKDRDYIVCLCRKTTLGEVEDLIKEHNITTLRDLCEIGNTGNKCGGCREELEEILMSHLE